MPKNHETIVGNSLHESAYAPSINTKSIMKQSVFSPSDNQTQTKLMNEQKKVQIIDSKELVFKSNRDSVFHEAKANLRDIESPMVNIGSRIN